MFNAFIRGLLLILFAYNPILSFAATALDLNIGWNLLGNSSASPIDVTKAFGDSSKITSVWKWNKGAAKWAFYAPSMIPDALATYSGNKGYDVLSSIGSKEGFWVNASGTNTFTGTSTNGVALIESDLQPGWNLVSSADNKPPADLNVGLCASMNTTGKATITQWAWDSTNSNWKFYAPSLDAQGGNALTNYTTQKGYLPFNSPISVTDGFWMNIGAIAAGSATCTNSPPIFPGIALVAATDSTSAVLAWLEAQDDATPPSQIKYNVYLSSDPLFSPSDATLNQTLTGQKQTIITGLAAGATYYIQVVAIDQQGLMSAVTDEAHVVTTLDAPVLFSPTVPLTKAADLNLGLPKVVGSDYHFASTGLQTPPAVGSILVGEDSNGNGYLTKVTNTSLVAGELIVQTAQGALSEAVTQGGIETSSILFTPLSSSAAVAAMASNVGTRSKTPVNLTLQVWDNKLLSFEETAATNLPSGVSVLKNADSGRYTITALPDSSGQVQTLAMTGSSSESLTYDVGLTFSPRLKTQLKWTTGFSGVTLTKGNLIASGTLSLDANAIYNFTGVSNYTKDLTFDVFKRTYTSVYTVGGVPVYQQITFTLGAHVEATATTAINANTKAHISETLSFGVSYNPTTGAWDPVASIANSKSLTANLSVNGGVTSTIRLIPNIEVKFYSAAAANLSFEPVLTGNIQASSIANADFLAGSFPPGITQLTAFDANLNAECYVGANLQFLGATIPLLSKTKVCDIAVANFFSLPTLALTSKPQSTTSILLNATVTNGANDLFNDASVRWTVYPADAGTLTPTSGNARQAAFAFASGKTSATVFFSGYGALGELGRQFAQTNIKAVVPILTINEIGPVVAPGLNLQLSVSATDQQGNQINPPPNLQWVSSNTSIVKVDSTGFLTGVSLGATSISVTDPVSNARTSITVNVTPNLKLIITPTNSSVLAEGGTVQLTVTPTDLQGNPVTVSGLTWTSYTSGVAVDNTGLVTADTTARAGNAFINVRDPISGVAAYTYVAVTTTPFIFAVDNGASTYHFRSICEDTPSNGPWCQVFHSFHLVISVAGPFSTAINSRGGTIISCGAWTADPTLYVGIAGTGITCIRDASSPPTTTIVAQTVYGCGGEGCFPGSLDFFKFYNGGFNGYLYFYSTTPVQLDTINQPYDPSFPPNTVPFF